MAWYALPVTVVQPCRNSPTAQVKTTYLPVRHCVAAVMIASGRRRSMPCAVLVENLYL